MKVLELAVKPRLELKSDGKTYVVEFPLSAVAEAGQKLGRPLVTLSDWLGLQSSSAEVVPVLCAGIKKHQPEVPEAEIADFVNELSAENLLALRYTLIRMNFPEAMTRYEESLQKGKASPNAPSGAAQ